jgi:hypothetical protein
MRIARIAAGVALAVALYALAGFVLAPRLARHALLTDIPKALGVTPSVGEIHINPFLLQVEVKDFALAGKDAQKLLGFDRLFVDFELSSLWRRAYSFGRIEIASPYVNAAVATDGTLNLAELRPKPAPQPAAAKSGPLPALRIGDFRVTQGRVSYEDRSRPSEFAARLEPITFELKDFTTGVTGGLFTFTGSSKLGERIEWHGHVSVQPIESDGEFRIDGLHARTLWEYLEDRLNFVINSGTIDLAATYKFSLRDAPELALDVASISVADLAVRPRDSDADWISVPGLSVKGVSVNLAQRQAQVDSLSLSGVKILGCLEPDGSLNLQKLTAPRSPGAKPAPAVPPPTLHAEAGAAPAANGVADPPWRVDLREFEIRDANISAEDRTLQPAAKITLAPLSLRIEAASLDLSKPVKVALDTRINETGSLKVTGDLTPQPLGASLSLKLADVDLTMLQPYIARYTSMSLRSGKLGSDAEVRYGAGKQAPALQFSGNIWVEKLHTVDEVRHDDFINWDRLDVRGLSYQQAADRLEISEVVARKPYARVIIESDSSFNVKRVLSAPGAAPPPPATSPVAAQSPRAGTVAASRTAAGGDAVMAAQAPGTAKPMAMAIKKIMVQKGQANFTDLSVTPNFSAGLQDLEGSVLGLSSKPNSRASVDLHGNVDAFSPVTIKGEVNLLSAALYTDIAMDFRNMELSIFNPYSGKFAGYNITKGKLTTELHYKVQGRMLDAQHHIVIDQLEFGDKTASKDAVSLPVKLAVALLKDRNGVIDLSLPVTGSLDDPKFRLAPIIWKVLVNILEKAVTAPFALLGSLFGGGPDIQFIEFKAGASALDPAASDKIKAVVKALKERPQLKIEVPIAADPAVDSPALVGALLTAQLSEAQAEAAQKSNRKKAALAAPMPGFDELDAPARLQLLTQLYVKNLGAEPKYPEELTAQKPKPEILSAKIDFLTAGLREHISVGANELRSLGEQRAAAIQQALLTDTQVEPERVFLVANDKASAKDGVVRLELSLR